MPENLNVRYYNNKATPLHFVSRPSVCLRLRTSSPAKGGMSKEGRSDSRRAQGRKPKAGSKDGLGMNHLVHVLSGPFGPTR